jgi:creatinine amidohydrolase
MSNEDKPGILLEDLSWTQAESLLSEASLVVIPIGAAAKEHGPHLRLKTDWILADYLKMRILERCDVVVAPTLTYHHYPAFVDYPGSTSLRLATAQNLTIDVCRSLARHGPRRFYALNTGISTLSPLERAASSLARQQILLRYTNMPKAVRDAIAEVSQQEGGTHADEIETSMMLYIDPTSVEMAKAVKDYHPASGPLRRKRGRRGAYSPTGVYGDATLATAEKGRKVIDLLIEAVIKDIEELRYTLIQYLR